MSRYGEDKKKEHLSLTKRALVRKPDITLTQLMGVFAKNGTKISIEYASRLVKKIRTERAYRYDKYTKAIIVAEFQDFISDLEPRLREIAESGNTKAAVAAIQALVQNKKDLINMAMDLGLLERMLGTIDVNTYNVAEISKLVKQANEQRNNSESNTG